MARTPDEIQPDEDGGYGRFSTGILPSHVLKRLIRARPRDRGRRSRSTTARSSPPASTCGWAPMAWRVRASFLPGPHATVEDKLAVRLHARDRSDARRGAGNGLRLYRAAAGARRIFRARFRHRQSQKLHRAHRRLHPADHRPRARPSTASSRAIAGRCIAEISPRTFPVLVRKGSRLNQLRIRHGSPQFTDTQLRRLHAESPLVDRRAPISTMAWRSPST